MPTHKTPLKPSTLVLRKKDPDRWFKLASHDQEVHLTLTYDRLGSSSEMSSEPGFEKASVAHVAVQSSFLLSSKLIDSSPEAKLLLSKYMTDELGDLCKEAYKYYLSAE